MDDAGPTARALLALELIQGNPGITADQLGERLGVTGRAARRYVSILRSADIPIESEPGRYGGYRAGRGLRLPPLMFSATEALGLVMAVLEGHGAVDPADPVGTALAKLVRVLPDAVARPADAVRRVRGGRPTPPTDPEVTARLVQASTTGHRHRISYHLSRDRVVEMDVDPWAVVVRYGFWYLLCWSHTRDAQRVLRIDKVGRIEELPETFTAPADLDPIELMEDHLSQGWRHPVEVEIDAPLDTVRHWLPRSLGRLEALDDARTRLVATTDEGDWFARQLTRLHAPFRVTVGDEVRREVALLGERLTAAAR